MNTAMVVVPRTGVCIRNTEKRKKFTPTLFQASIVEFPRKADRMNLDMIRCFEVFLFEEMQSKIEVNMARKKINKK